MGREVGGRCGIAMGGGRRAERGRFRADVGVMAVGMEDGG